MSQGLFINIFVLCTKLYKIGIAWVLSCAAFIFGYVCICFQYFESIARINRISSICEFASIPLLNDPVKELFLVIVRDRCCGCNCLCKIFVGQRILIASCAVCKFAVSCIKYDVDAVSTEEFASPFCIEVKAPCDPETFCVSVSFFYRLAILIQLCRSALVICCGYSGVIQNKRIKVKCTCHGCICIPSD